MQKNFEKFDNNNKKKTNSRRTSNKKSGKRNQRTSFDKTDMATDVGSNDVSWYIKHKSLAVDAGSIPYGIPLGVDLNRGYDVFSPLVYTDVVDGVPSIPGIMRMTLAPTFGVSDSYSSPINRAAQMLYTFVRHVNSGHANYDPNDLVMYIGAMGNIYSYITWLDRLYGSFQVYSQMNSYLAKSLITAMCVDFDDILVHMMDLKYYIDQITVRASAFCIPGDLALFSRWAFLYQNIYTDGSSPKDGLYFYNPAYFYKYGTLNNVGRLIPEPFFDDSNLATFNDLVQYGNTLLDAVAASEDVGIMSGDILKAYGQDKLIKLATVPFGYTVLPVFNEEVLEQFHNADVLPFRPDFTNTTVQSSWALDQYGGIGGYLICDPLMRVSDADMAEGIKYQKKLITSKLDPVSPEVTILNTRLAFFYDFGTPSGTYTLSHITTCGSEVPVALDVIIHVQGVSNTIPVLGAGFTAGPSTTIDDVTFAEHFHYHPVLPLVIADADEAVIKISSCFDVDNYAVLDEVELRNIHESAWLSMLAVPLMGAYEN